MSRGIKNLDVDKENDIVQRIYDEREDIDAKYDLVVTYIKEHVKAKNKITQFLVAAENDMKIYEYIGKLYGVTPKIIPVPMCNVINGGKHAGQENSVQEHMIMPTGAKNFTQGIRIVSETYHHLAKLLKKRYVFTLLITFISDMNLSFPKQYPRMASRKRSVCGGDTLLWH